MPIIQSGFSPPLHLRNPHIQTLLPSLTRKPSIPQRSIVEMQTHDKDIILLEEAPCKNEHDHAVLLIHGLTGSADSQYVVGLQNLFRSHGIFSIAMNFRGAKKPNFLASGYHSGSSDDLKEIISFLHDAHPSYHWHAMGFSLGGNVLLKYLGENPNSPLISGFAASVPFKLDVCSTRLDKGFSRIYRNHLLKELKIYLAKKHEHLEIVNSDEAKRLLQTPIKKNFNSFWQLDHEIIAPIHGFASAKDYYDKCSSGQFLKTIKTPTHILNALDDPFLAKELIPKEDELSDYVTLEVSEYGGHVGFYGGGNKYYIEELAMRWLSPSIC